MAGSGKIGGRKPVLRVVEGDRDTRTKIRGPALADGLTAKQEAFSVHVASGLSLAESYRRSYNVQNMKPASVWQRASALFDDAKVTSRVDSILAEKERETLHDSRRAKDWLFQNLQKIVEHGETDGAKVAAMQVVARMHALLTDRQEVETSDARTTDELREELASALATLANPPRRRA